jgi:hypothetical protein
MFRPEPLDLTKPKHGRRRKNLTSEEIDTFCRALNAPATFEVACGIVSIPERTMRDWIAKGQDPDQDDELLVELAHKFNYTMAHGNRGALMKLNLEHARDDPKASIEMMRVLIPSANAAKNIKMDASLSLTATQDNIPWHLATDEEVEIIQRYEAVKLRLRGLA